MAEKICFEETVRRELKPQGSSSLLQWVLCNPNTAGLHGRLELDGRRL